MTTKAVWQMYYEKALELGFTQQQAATYATAEVEYEKSVLERTNQEYGK